MKKTIIIATLILVLGLSIVVQAQKETSRWEYANIQFDAFGVWFWKEPQLYAQGETVTELCRELSILPVRTNTPGLYTDDPELYTLIKWAGQNGWELISIDQRVSFISVWFKRRPT